MCSNTLNIRWKRVKMSAYELMESAHSFEKGSEAFRYKKKRDQSVIFTIVGDFLVYDVKTVVRARSKFLVQNAHWVPNLVNWSLFPIIGDFYTRKYAYSMQNARIWHSRFCLAREHSWIFMREIQNEIYSSAPKKKLFKNAKLRSNRIHASYKISSNTIAFSQLLRIFSGNFAVLRLICRNWSNSKYDHKKRLFGQFIDVLNFWRLSK